VKNTVLRMGQWVQNKGHWPWSLAVNHRRTQPDGYYHHDSLRSMRYKGNISKWPQIQCH